MVSGTGAGGRAWPRPRRPGPADARVVAFSAIAMTMTAYGQTPGVAVFVDAVITDLRLDRGAVSGAYAIATLVSAFVLPWIGRRMDIDGVRTITLGIAIGFGLALVVLAGAESVVWLVVGFAGIRTLGQGALSLASRHAVTLHFRVGLGRAVAISGSIAALVMSVVPFLLAALIASVGWRGTWLLAAASVWIVLLPLTLLLLRGTAAVPPGPRVAEAGEPIGWTRARALRSPMFWLITLANSANAVILTGFNFHHLSVLGEAGIGAEAAAGFFVPLTIASILFLAVVAPLAGRWSSKRLLAAAMAPLVLGMALVSVLASPVVPLVYAVALGSSLGAGQVLDGILYPRHFGVHAIGAIRSAGFTVVASASAAGPVIVSLIHDVTGGYAAVALLLAVAPLAVIAAALLLRPDGGPSQGPSAPARTRVG